MSEPRPVVVIPKPAASNSPSSAARKRSPRAFSAASASGVSTSLKPAAPAAMVRTSLLKVPEWYRQSGLAGSKRSIRSARPPKAPNEEPPPRYLPSAVRSGVTPQAACSPPVDRREVMTSSNTKRMPWRVVSARSISRKPGAAGMQPPAPNMGSRMTAARSSPWAVIWVRVAAMSL